MPVRQPFVVFALPRSRTAWLSHFLSYGDTIVGHDIGIECREIEDFKIPFVHGMAGTVETGAMIAWRQIRELLPNVKFAVIKRPIWQVIHSLGRHGIEPSVEELISRDDQLDAIINLAGTHVVDYEALRTEHGCKLLFEFCLGQERAFDHGWYELLRDINIQVKMGETIARLQQNGDSLAALKRQIADLNYTCPGNA